jgi:hypothetical protein
VATGGTCFENCTCDTVCPCTTSGFTMSADHGQQHGTHVVTDVPTGLTDRRVRGSYFEGCRPCHALRSTQSGQAHVWGCRELNPGPRDPPSSQPK